MSYLNNISSDGQSQKIGTKINKVSFDGTVYNLGLDTSDATLKSEWGLIEPNSAYSNGKKYTGIVKNRSEIGSNGVTETQISNVKFCKSTNPGFVSESTKADTEHIYLGFKPENGYYDGFTFTGLRPVEAKVNDRCVGFWSTNGSYTPVYLGSYFQFHTFDAGVKCLESGNYHLRARCVSNVINHTLKIQKNGSDILWGNSNGEGYSTIESDVYLNKNDVIHIQIDMRGSYGQAGVGFEYVLK